MSSIEGMRPVHWAAQPSDTPADARARAGLRKRFAGLDAQIGRAVGQMADYERERTGLDPAPVRIFPEIVPVMAAGLSIATGWTVYVTAHGPGVERLTGRRELRMPVIPDEHNQRPGKVIVEGDRPFEFASMLAAERAAEEAVAAMRASLRKPGALPAPK